MALERAQTMLDWLVSKGGYVHPSAALNEDTDAGLALFATAPIPADERIVSCPFDVAITSALASRAVAKATGVAASELVWPNGDKKGDMWNERMLAAAYIGLHWIWDEREKEEGKTRPAALAHGPYVAALPTPDELTTPLYFAPAERALLSGTNLAGAVADREAEWGAESAAVRAVLKEEGLTWERYLAVATYLSSRAFPSRLLRLPGEETDDDGVSPVLLPGVDMLNHARGQPILWLSSKIPSTTGADVAAISLRTAATHDTGAQLFNNYGAKPNEELLLGYGFVLPSNPDDTVVLRLGGAPPAPVAARLSAKGLDATERFAVGRSGELPQRLLEVLRVMMGDGEDEHQCHSDDDEEDDHAHHLAEEKGFNLELDVLGMLGEMLEDKVDKLSREVEAKGARPRVVAMVEEYRKGQTEILTTALDKLGDRVDRIESLMSEGLECPCGC